MRQPLVSVVVATYNAERWVHACLKSLLAQSYPPEKVEIIVIDDGSSDGTRAILEEWTQKSPNIKLILQDNQGTARAHTVGLQNAAGEYVFMLSHDAYAAPDWLSSVAQIFEQNPEVGIVQGQVRAMGEIVEPVVHTVEFDRFNRSFATVAIAYRAPALDAAGRFYDEELSRYGDDAELAYRILKRGAKSVFLEKLTASHEVVPEPFWKSIKEAWGRQKFCLLYKMHPQARVFLRFGFLWGSAERYSRILFWPFLLTLSLLAYLYDKKIGIKWTHLLFEELVFSASLIWGSIKYQSLIL